MPGRRGADEGELFAFQLLGGIGVGTGLFSAIVLPEYRALLATTGLAVTLFAAIAYAWTWWRA
jgi:hypothetical protein